MALKLKKETELQALSSIKRYFAEEREEELGELKAMLYLDFFMKEIAPSIYNQAIYDAQGHLQEKLNDLDGTCYEQPFAYWNKGKK